MSKINFQPGKDDAGHACWPDFLQWAATHYPQNIALLTASLSFTYDQLNLMVSDCCTKLSEHGLKSGDHVMLIADHNVETVVLLLACFRLQICVCPINPKLPDKALFSLIDNLNIKSFVGHRPSPTDEPVLSPDSLVDLSKASALKRAQQTKHQKFGYRADSLATLILSSGSTGRPKAVAHRYDNHIYSALASNRLLAQTQGDRYLLSLPLYHIGGLQIIFRCLLAGATMVLANKAHAHRALNEFKISHVSMVATQLKRLLDQNVSPNYLKVILVGGGPVSGELLAVAASRQIPCYLTYGLTEMSSQVVTHDPTGKAHVLTHSEMKLDSDGSILVKGLTLCAGYYQKELHPLPLDHDGWFDTRDLGVWANGHFSVLGRKDNQFISGGENIQPEEIERYCVKIPGIKQAIIVALPSETYGCSPALFVDKESKVSIDTIQRELRQWLPSFKIPQQMFVLPDSQSLKENRCHLQQLASMLAMQQTSPQK